MNDSPNSKKIQNSGLSGAFISPGSMEKHLTLVEQTRRLESLKNGIGLFDLMTEIHDIDRLNMTDAMYEKLVKDKFALWLTELKAKLPDIINLETMYIDVDFNAPSEWKVDIIPSPALEAILGVKRIGNF